MTKVFLVKFFQLQHLGFPTNPASFASLEGFQFSLMLPPPHIQVSLLMSSSLPRDKPCSPLSPAKFLKASQNQYEHQQNVSQGEWQNLCLLHHPRIPQRHTTNVEMVIATLKESNGYTQ